MDRPGISALYRFLASGLLVALGACGGGADTVQNSAGPGGAPAAYTGPPPATADVQAFKINVWENLKATNRCGQCHVGGGQTPQFVRQDDVNLAYEAANTVVTLSSPKDSQMVLKVGGGHNCWLASNEACAEKNRRERHWICAWDHLIGERLRIAQAIVRRPEIHWVDRAFVLQEPGAPISKRVV